MKNQIKTSAPFIYFVIAILLSIWAKNSFGQTTENVPTEIFFCFKYDDLAGNELYPATVSVQKLEDDEIFIKLYRYGSILPNGKFGLPSIEKIDYSRTREIFKSLQSHLVHPEYEGCWYHYLTHLIKDDTKDNDTAHLIKEEDEATAHLIKDDTKSSDNS